ncbi:MAG: hypothetical protein Q8N15_03620 [Bacillota bacterium]|nr:hypothetical protein [Bacillota bacterium]
MTESDMKGVIAMMTIDRETIRQELDQKNLLELHRELTRERKWRTGVMIVLMTALLFTIVYGTLENPFVYTFSNIGNFFAYRWLFIVWSIVSGIAIQTAILALFRLEDYAKGKKRKNVFLFLSVVFLVATALIPALREEYPFWHVLHFVTAILHALFVFAAFIPFVLFVSKENPRLRLIISLCIAVVWGGALLALFLAGKSGLFEMWFYVGMILFLLYLSLILFEEKIVKLSVAFLRDEANLNEAIEKYFIDLEAITKKAKRAAASQEATDPSASIDR